MKARVFWVWLIVVVIGVGLVFVNVSRSARREERFGSGDATAVWETLPLTIALMIALQSAGIGLVLVAYGWGRRNERRVLAADTHGDVVTVAGIRNHHPAMKEGWPLHGVSGLGDFSTVIRVTSEGLELLAGIRALRRAVGYSWSEVESIDVAVLDKETYKQGAGAGVDVRIRGFAHPLRFGLVERPFPWVDPMPESGVREFVDALREIHGNATRPKPSKG